MTRQIIGWFVVGVAAIMVTIGIFLQVKSNSNFRKFDGARSQSDSSITKVVKVDSLFFHEVERKVKTKKNKDSVVKLQKPGLKVTQTTTTISVGRSAIDNWSDLAYKYLTLGTGLLLFLFILPTLSEFSFLNLFSGKFREVVDARKAESNAAEEGSAKPDLNKDNSVTVISQKKLSRDGKEKTVQLVQYNDDPQKGKWGGKPESNGRKITAIVTQSMLSRKWFNVELRVASTDVSKPLTGKVNFHLHDSFINQNPSIFVKNGTASLRITAYGAFTVGAEADNGRTQLELDLAEIDGAPKLFKES